METEQPYCLYVVELNVCCAYKRHAMACVASAARPGWSRCRSGDDGQGERTRRAGERRKARAVRGGPGGGALRAATGRGDVGAGRGARDKWTYQVRVSFLTWRSRQWARAVHRAFMAVEFPGLSELAACAPGTAGCAPARRSSSTSAATRPLASPRAPCSAPSGAS
jgi:hypothetical protein